MKKVPQMFNNSRPAYITLTIRSRHDTRSVTVFTQAQAMYIINALPGKRIEVDYHYNTYTASVMSVSTGARVESRNIERREKVHTLAWDYVNGKLNHILRRYSVVTAKRTV